MIRLKGFGRKCESREATTLVKRPAPLQPPAHDLEDLLLEGVLPITDAPSLNAGGAISDGNADQIVKSSRPVLSRLLCQPRNTRNTMAAPLNCVYCRKPIAPHRDNYVLLPSEHPAGGDYQRAHLACMEASTRDIDAHPTAGGREPICHPFETVYLIHRAAYRFALVIPRTVPSAVRRGLAFFRLWLTGQAPQDGVVLTVPELTAIYDDLGRLLEFIGHEHHARARSHPPPGDGGARP